MREEPKMKVKLDEGAYMPERAHATDAGADIRSREDKIVPWREYATFDTGVHLEIPHGYMVKVESKSGLNCNHGLTAVGVVDEGYTGSIRVILHNSSMTDYHVHAGDKIAQIILVPVEYPTFELADELGETDRGTDGFGSTGRA